MVISFLLFVVKKSVACKWILLRKSCFFQRLKYSKETGENWKILFPSTCFVYRQVEGIGRYKHRCSFHSWVCLEVIERVFWTYSLEKSRGSDRLILPDFLWQFKILLTQLQNQENRMCSPCSSPQFSIQDSKSWWMWQWIELWMVCVFCKVHYWEINCQDLPKRWEVY